MNEVAGRELLRALARSRLPIVGVALTHVVSITIGMAMVHAGSRSALGFRDRLVARANAADPAAIALHRGDRMQAALWDFGRNLFLGALPSTVGGLAVVPPYLQAAYRGWVGGVVSVDRAHASRLAEPRERAYYLLVLVLQLIPYSLAGGAGVRLGQAFYAARGGSGVVRWLGLPKDAVLDVARIYGLVAPMFLVVSLWEFLAR